MNKSWRCNNSKPATRIHSSCHLKALYDLYLPLPIRLLLNISLLSISIDLMSTTYSLPLRTNHQARNQAFPQIL